MEHLCEVRDPVHFFGVRLSPHKFNVNQPCRVDHDRVKTGTQNRIRKPTGRYSGGTVAEGTSDVREVVEEVAAVVAPHRSRLPPPPLDQLGVAFGNETLIIAHRDRTGGDERWPCGVRGVC